MSAGPRTALVTGASRGLGRVVAETLARQGVRCLLLAREGDALREAEQAVRAAGSADARALPFDLETMDGPGALAAALARLTDRLDIVVANAALGGVRVPLPEYPPELWRRLFQVNVHAVQALLAATHPLLARSPGGRVVFVSTGVARRWKAHTGAYGASKAALEAIAGIYAAETAATPIRANVVNPGPTRTAMRAEAFPDEDPGSLKTPEDIAPLFAELCAPECSRHGEVIDADAWLAQRQLAHP